jgi:hypothetical protein
MVFLAAGAEAVFVHTGAAGVADMELFVDASLGGI